MQEQFKALGAEVVINQAEPAVFNEKLFTAEYDIALGGWGWDNYSLLLVYTSGQVGALNRLNLQNPELDALVMGAIFTGDQTVIDQSLQAAQQRIVEQANIAPLYTSYYFDLVSNRVEGEMFAPLYSSIWLFDAYIK